MRAIATTKSEIDDVALVALVDSRPKERKGGERERCSTWSSSGAASRMSPSDGVCGLRSTASRITNVGPKRPITRGFTNFLGPAVLSTVNFADGPGVAARNTGHRGRPSGAKEFTSGRYGFSVDTARKNTRKTASRKLIVTSISLSPWDRGISAAAASLTFLHALGHAVPHYRSFADVFLKQTRRIVRSAVKWPPSQ